jgi:hypothetical protein
MMSTFSSRARKTSKCGRLTIERIEYVLPTVSVAYRLTDTSLGRSTDHDTLRDAKYDAEELATPESTPAQATVWRLSAKKARFVRMQVPRKPE